MSAAVALSPMGYATPTTSPGLVVAKETKGPEFPVLWNGKRVDLASQGQGDATASLADVGKHLERYAAWVRDHDYRVSVSKDARVVLITANETIAKGRMELVERTLAAFEKAMPSPERSGLKESYRGGEWGVREHVPDAEPVVLIELASGGDYQTLLAAMEQEAPAMQTWASIHGSAPGFDEVRVMAAAWQSAPAGYEKDIVWRSENELVNRLSRMLLYRSYGPQPTWLTQACAWAIEQAVKGDIYCFPFRSGFVGADAHKGWEAELKALFKGRKGQSLQMNEFAEWKRGTWDLQEAAIAWGFVQFLVQHKPGALPALLESNRVAYKAGFTTVEASGKWFTNPGFEVPSEAQLETLMAVAGENVLDEASAFFRLWKRFKPAKTPDPKPSRGAKRESSKRSRG